MPKATIDAILRMVRAFIEWLDQYIFETIEEAREQATDWL